MPITDSRALEPNIAIAAIDGHFVASICAKPTSAVPAQLEAFVRRQPQSQRFAYYLRIGEGASPPDEETRAKLRELGTRLGTRVVAVAAIVEIPGFMGAAVRSVVTGMSLFLGRSVKIRPASNATEGASAIASTIRDAGLTPLDAATLEAALATLRTMRP